MISVEELRSEEASAFSIGYYDLGIHPIESDWADWLEKRLFGEKG